MLRCCGSNSASNNPSGISSMVTTSASNQTIQSASKVKELDHEIELLQSKHRQELKDLEVYLESRVVQAQKEREEIIVLPIKAEKKILYYLNKNNEIIKTNRMLKGKKEVVACSLRYSISSIGNETLFTPENFYEAIGKNNEPLYKYGS